MKTWVTEIKAMRPADGELITYGGPNVPGICKSDAEAYCERNGLGYCKVIGELVCEIPCKEGTYEPDFKNRVDYDSPSLN